MLLEEPRNNELRICRSRFGAVAREGRYENYAVPQRASQTVLDVVTFVQRHIDPTLSYRFACRVGVCGSCAMTVNGQPRWTCRTHVSKVAGGGRLEIGPLENLPVIKDLATDMERFFEKWQRGQGGALRRRRHGTTTSSRSGRTARSARPLTRPSNASIAACATRPVTRCVGIPNTWARRRSIAGLDAGERRARRGNSARLQAVAASGGCHACHSHQSCQEFCPQTLNPTASIAGPQAAHDGGLSQGRDQGMNVRLYRLAARYRGAHGAAGSRPYRRHLLRHTPRADGCGYSARTRGSIVVGGVLWDCLLRRHPFMLRSVSAMSLTEWSPLRDRGAGVFAVAFGLALAVLGFRAVAAVVLS